MADPVMQMPAQDFFFYSAGIFSWFLIAVCIFTLYREFFK